MSGRSFDPAERGERRLDAYYYGFDPTGVEPVDNLLAAVASAGKMYHHTEDWGEPCYGEESCAGAIQRMANEAAEALRRADELSRLEAEREAELRGLRGEYAERCRADGWFPAGFVTAMEQRLTAGAAVLARRAEESERRYRELVGQIEARAAEMEARSTSVCDAIASELRSLLDDTPAPQEAPEPAGLTHLRTRLLRLAERLKGWDPDTYRSRMLRRGVSPSQVDTATVAYSDARHEAATLIRREVDGTPESLRREDDEIEAVLQEHDEGGDRGQD